jgi:hypothetical protein
MRAAINVLVLLFILVVTAGIIVALAARVRRAADRANCQNNLRQIGLALQDYHDCYGHFPTGTVPNPSLPPDRRLSWIVLICPDFMEGGVASLLDRAKAWDAPGNCPPRFRVRVDDEGHTREVVLDPLPLFCCPANPEWDEPGRPGPTHYVGVGGVGLAAAGLPLSDPRAGFFGYDRTLTRADVKDGLATTAAVIEATDGGPWTAGGRATVRGLARERLPYLGEGGQFPAHHGGVSSVLFADASVRPVAADVSPGVLEALATVAGGERVEAADY